MAEHNDLGAWGEQVAREYLLSQGYAIGAENTRWGKVEIDFIAMKDGEVCFVEVKTRSDDFADPADAVDAKKRARLVRAADAYIREHDLPMAPRFDLIFVTGTPEKGYEIEHIPDAFYPALNGGRY